MSIRHRDKQKNAPTFRLRYVSVVRRQIGVEASGYDSAFGCSVCTSTWSYVCHCSTIVRSPGAVGRAIALQRISSLHPFASKCSPYSPRASVERFESEIFASVCLCYRHNFRNLHALDERKCLCFGEIFNQNQNQE